MPSSPPAEAPLLRLALPDGRPATLLAGPASTVLSVDDAFVSSWDLAGRPYALVRETGTYRRGLDGGILWKREATARAPRLRRRLSAAEGEPIVEAARREAQAALGVLRGSDAPGSAGSTIVHRLETIVAMDGAALRDDAARFLAASGPVGILPPDQYLALVVRVTEGCSWNACTFCRLYRDVTFRARRPDEVVAHVAALRAYFGRSLALRRSVFLGDANALCLARQRLLPLLEAVAGELPGAPLYSFLDGWTGQRKAVAEWRDYAALGLRRVYVGLETGDPGLLAWLEKAGSPQDAVDLVGALHEAGIAAGVIVLLGAGGERFARPHAARTAEALTAMRLGPDDLLYFSEYADEPGLAYGRRAAGAPDLQPLPPPRNAELRREILEGCRPATPGLPPRSATYDIREFVY
ncbi:MAG TPA: radical SAM protein [Vicinamibacteria bacterium]|nr:radical SAM protein [Vicinamibacteria bacterium]